MQVHGLRAHAEESDVRSVRQIEQRPIAVVRGFHTGQLSQRRVDVVVLACVEAVPQWTGIDGVVTERFDVVPDIRETYRPCVDRSEYEQDENEPPAFQAIPPAEPNAIEEGRAKNDQHAGRQLSQRYGRACRSSSISGSRARFLSLARRKRTELTARPAMAPRSATAPAAANPVAPGCR